MAKKMNSEYRELLLDIADELTSREFARMKFLCADILPDVKPDHDNSGELLSEVLNFFRELEKQDVLSVDNLDKLRYLLEKAKRNDLVAKIEDFQLRSTNNERPSLLSSSSMIGGESKTFDEVVQQQIIERPECGEGKTSSFMSNGEEKDPDAKAPDKKAEDTAKERRRRKKREKYKRRKKTEKESNSISEDNNNVIPNTLSSISYSTTSKEAKTISTVQLEKQGDFVELLSEKKDEVVRKEMPELMREDRQTAKRGETVEDVSATANKHEKVRKDLPNYVREKEEMVKDHLPREEIQEKVKDVSATANKHEVRKDVPNYVKGKEKMVKDHLPRKTSQEELQENGLPKAKKEDVVTTAIMKGLTEETCKEKLPKNSQLKTKKQDRDEKVIEEEKDEMIKRGFPTTKKEVKKGNSFSTGSVAKLSKELSGAVPQKRHILSLCSRWQSWGESMPVFNRELCLALARAGHRVMCIVLVSSDYDKEDARKGNVELLQCDHKPGIQRDDPQLLYHDQQIPFLPDIVIGHGKLTGPASVFHADKASCPRLHIIHDLPSECLKFDSVLEPQCNEEQLAKTADFVAVIGSLLNEKWSTLINRNVIELIPGLPELTTRNRIPSPQCRCFVPAKFCAPLASGLRLAIKTVNCSSEREPRPRKTTLIACNTDSSGSVKPGKKVLKEIDRSLVDLNERISINSQEAYFDIQGATVFLSPARVDAFGVTALDAIAIGIPIVISEHSGLAYTIRRYFDKKFHSFIKGIKLEEGASIDDEEDEDAAVWAISIDKISISQEEAFDLADTFRSDWKEKFTWDTAVHKLMRTITESGKLPFRSPVPLSTPSLATGVAGSCINLVKELNLFDRRQKFVLFLSPENLELMNNAVHLGLVHWAAVFDFDRESTTKGYLKSCEHFLESTGKPACRMLPPPKEDIGKENQHFTLPNGGIPWILLQGVPDMERDVDRNLDWIQEIFCHLRKRLSTNITLLILWNSTNDNRHLCKKLYQIQLQVQASPHWKNAVQLALLSTSDQIDSRLDDIAEEWGVKIKKIDINQFCNALYSTATANPLYQLDPDFSLPKRNVNGMQGDITSATLPSSMRWVDSVLEVLYTSIGNTPEFGKDDAHYFYRGGKISWYGIEMDYAVERESWEPLRKTVEEELAYPGATFLTLFHQRGTGGTTSARRLLYDFHLRYPCVCLKTINYETFLAIKVIWEFCSLPVIILADIKEFPGAEDNDIEALYGNLSNEKVSCLILHIVHCHYQVEPKREKEVPSPKDIILAKSLTEKERKNFIKVYSLQSPAKKSELRAMKHGDEHLQIPFYYGLVAFGEQFKGLEPFVSDCLRGLNEHQRKALCFLSMAHQYAQLELPLSIYAGVFNLKPRQLYSIEDILTPESIELLNEECGCWRPRHCTIGKEILRQLLTVPYNIHPENWQRNLADKAIEFISYMEEETSNAVLLNRISDEKTYKRFSSLVEDIPEDEDAVKVFKKAIAVHPNNPFFKAHLGRYYSVRRGLEGFDLALEYTDSSLLLASGMSKNIRSQLTQMRGMIFKRQVKNQIEKSANLADIISLAKKGVEAFTRAASISPDRLENCYIPQVRMMCDVFRYIAGNSKGGIFQYLHSQGADPFILDEISESSDILESVSESIYYPDLRRDLFTLGGFGRRNRSGNKADLINHFKELKQTSRTSTASINRQIVLLQLELCKDNDKPVSEIAEELNLLLEEALKYDNKIDLTMRLWVRVAPHIPVDLQAAESKMAAWCTQGKSPLSYLYRYIFTCIRILEGGRDQRFEDDRKIARDDLLKAVHAAKRLTLSHPDRPVVFLGTAKGMGQLVTVEESVTNVRKQRSIPDSFAKRLRKLTGIIKKTGKVGQIKAADGLVISFRADLCQPPLTGQSYLAKKVRFYLAFTYFEADAYNVKIVAE